MQHFAEFLTRHQALAERESECQKLQASLICDATKAISLFPLMGEAHQTKEHRNIYTTYRMVCLCHQLDGIAGFPAALFYASLKETIRTALGISPEELDSYEQLARLIYQERKT